MSRKEFEMSEEDLAAILDACRPTPVMFLSGGIPLGQSPQERANSAWSKLGDRLGFNHMSVQPVREKGDRFFTAEQKQACLECGYLPATDADRAAVALENESDRKRDDRAIEMAHR